MEHPRLRHSTRNVQPRDRPRELATFIHTRLKVLGPVEKHVEAYNEVLSAAGNPVEWDKKIGTVQILEDVLVHAVNSPETTRDILDQLEYVRNHPSPWYAKHGLSYALYNVLKRDPEHSFAIPYLLDTTKDLSRRTERVEEEMRGSACRASAHSQDIQKLLERVEKLEHITEVLRSDVVKATSLASHYKRELDNLSRRFDDVTANHRVQIQDLQHGGKQLKQQLDAGPGTPSPAAPSPHVELSQPKPVVARRLRGSRKPRLPSPAAASTLPNAAQMESPGIPLPPPRCLTQPSRPSAHRAPPSRSSSVPARPRAPWSRPSSPGLGADSPNWRRSSTPIPDPSPRPSIEQIRRHHHRDFGIIAQTDACPYCHRPWNLRYPRRLRVRNN
ncbi:hypothetical protein BKA70DRAFT_1429885 [Coprinopsis sp. MPI-PUGE-AT-0042]|nr:hypothetical protein BKA70DRAFT_1429885 [Coprinopsis sp. MPI-PUGE-AT-0042]